jgi:hypothetical protein
MRIGQKVQHRGQVTDLDRRLHAHALNADGSRHLLNRDGRKCDRQETSVGRPAGQGWCVWLRSNLVACSPDEDNESGDQQNNNEHPILAFETKKAKFLNEKFHRFRPFIGQSMVSCDRNILFFHA